MITLSIYLRCPHPHHHHPHPCDDAASFMWWWWWWWIWWWWWWWWGLSKLLSPSQPSWPPSSPFSYLIKATFSLFLLCSETFKKKHHQIWPQNKPPLSNQCYQATQANGATNSATVKNATTKETKINGHLGAGPRNTTLRRLASFVYGPGGNSRESIFAFLGELGGLWNYTVWRAFFHQQLVIACLFLGFYLGGLGCSISMMNIFQTNRCSSSRFVKHPKCFTLYTYFVAIKRNWIPCPVTKNEGFPDIGADSRIPIMWPTIRI